MLEMERTGLLDFYSAWSVAEEEQPETRKRVADQVGDVPSSSHCEKPKRKIKKLPQPLQTINVKNSDDEHDNVSPLEMISMKAAPCDGSDLQPDPCSPTEPTSEDENQGTQWYKDLDDLSDALLSKFLKQALEERANSLEQQNAFQQAQVAVAMASSPCLLQDQTAHAMPEAPWQFQADSEAPCLQQGEIAAAMPKAPWQCPAASELHGSISAASVAPRHCPKIQAPLPKMQASWPSTPSLPSVPPAKAPVQTQSSLAE